MPTPHINAKDNDFAKVVLMPGDPVRAKWIADTFLTDYVQVTDVRGILGFTGHTKNGKRISVMASGMGMPSIGIYTHELFTGYGVESIIRVGTCGSYQPNINLKDVIICMSASTDSNWIGQYHLNGTYAPSCDFDLAMAAVETARENNIPYFFCDIYDFIKKVQSVPCNASCHGSCPYRLVYSSVQIIFRGISQIFYAYRIGINLVESRVILQLVYLRLRSLLCKQRRYRRNQQRYGKCK